MCYDHSRVLLSQIDGDPCSDYINANFVDGYKQKNAFISTQGEYYLTKFFIFKSCLIYLIQCLFIQFKNHLLQIKYKWEICLFHSSSGPLPKTACDFWRMVWEQQALVVVMTTRVVERGRTKCGQYWEPAEGGTATYGNFSVTTTTVDQHPDYTVSSLQLTNLKVININ